MNQIIPLWLTVPKAARIAGVPKDGLYRDIRRGTCPFEVKKISGRLHVSARSLGLIPLTESRGTEPQNEPQVASATA